MTMRYSLFLLAFMFGCMLPNPGQARPRYQVERVVMLVRHGVRAPLDGEAAAARFAAAPFPRWASEPSLLTPHGAAALRLLAGADRARLIRQGVLPPTECPDAGAVRIWTNSVSRTIASGQAIAEGLIPACPIAIEHLPEGQADPLFDAIDAHAVPFDAVAAAASINAELDQGRTLMRGAAPGFATMARVLGCDRAAPACDFAAMPNRIEPTPDGKNIRLSGAIDVTSGTAQVFLLQYVQGLPVAQVGWGRASPHDIAVMSPLHAKLFDVFARSRYMAPRVGGPMARRIIAALTDADAAKVQIFVGHDNTIAAITALLGIHFRLPGYGRDDPPIGGELVFEQLRDRSSGRHLVRLSYRAQTPRQTRFLSGKSVFQPLSLPECGRTCDLPQLVHTLSTATTL